jgi:lipase
VLAPDLRGHGRSSYDRPWDIETHVADVLETVDDQRAAWIGHSFGGRLLLEIAARSPALVDRAVLLDPAIHVPPDVAAQLAAGERQDRSFSSVGEAIAKRIELTPLYGAPRELLEEEMSEHLVQSADGRFRYRYNQETVAVAYEEMARVPPPFEQARVPTLLVVADRSKLVSAAEDERYREALGDLLEVVAVPGGHIVLWDAFEESSAAIERFLSG